MALHWLRNACLFGLPILLILGLLGQSLAPPTYASFAEGAYIVLLTANIGYFTNFVAIKMLFKPHQRSAFGRQGLIPKNQKKLAKALSDTLSDHFLSSEHWEDYLQQAELLPKLIDSLQLQTSQWLAEPKNQRQLSNMLAAYLEQNADQFNRFFGELQAELLEQLADKINPHQLVEQGFNWLEQQFKSNPRQMEYLIEPIVRSLAANVPEIASKLVDTIDQQIEKQDTVRRNVAKAARWSANIDETSIREYLFKMLASSEFRQTLSEGLHHLITEYQTMTRPQDSLTANEQTAAVTDFTRLLKDFLSEKLTQVDIAAYLSRLLTQSDSRVNLNRLLNGLSLTLASLLKDKLSQPESQKKINQQLVQVIEHIDLREIIEEKAANFSAEKMESIFQRMISDQLVFIELLGALLGALSGFALIDLKWLLGFSGLAATYYLLDRFFTARAKTKALST